MGSTQAPPWPALRGPFLGRARRGGESGESTDDLANCPALTGASSHSWIGASRTSKLSVGKLPLRLREGRAARLATQRLVASSASSGVWRLSSCRPLLFRPWQLHNDPPRLHHSAPRRTAAAAARHQSACQRLPARTTGQSNRPAISLLFQRPRPRPLCCPSSASSCCCEARQGSLAPYSHRPCESVIPRSCSARPPLLFCMFAIGTLRLRLEAEK